MFKILVLLFIFCILLESLLICDIINEDVLKFYVHTDYYNLIIPKYNGMITSAKVKNVDFELVSDYSSGVVGSFYTLFFPEFSPENINTTVSNYEFYIPGSDGTSISYDLKCNNDSIAVLQFECNTNYISTIWEYNFINDECYFKVDIEKVVNKTNVYGNSQQCVMFNSDFDDTYIIDYTGNIHCTMSDNVYTYPRSATFQHTMFSAMDEGLTDIFPMMSWHDDGYDIIAGMINTYVSPNQRKTISYHGGGSNNVHPGFSEGQWNWFGKSDSESLFLREGLHYRMQMYYYINNGTISDMIDFNRNLFNESYYDIKTCENYYAASFGGRTSRLEKYFWRFPQVSSNYICSQELFHHRSFAIPCSQNGTRDPHIFDLYVKKNSYENYYDLTPIYGIEPLFDDAETIVGDDYMIGSMSWNVSSLENKLEYKVYEGSDKVQVSGIIKISANTTIKELFVELELSPRVNEVFAIDDSIFDIRCEDEIFDTIGIAVYRLHDIKDIELDDNSIRFYLLNNETDSLYFEGDSFEYSFSLFPHIGSNIEQSSDITHLLSAPVNFYREYYLTFPDQIGNNNFGFSPNPYIFPYNASLGNDSLIVMFDLFCNQGSYSMEIYLDEPKVETVLINDEECASWDYNALSKKLTIDNYWNEANYKIKIFNKEINNLSTKPTLQFYPNPSRSDAYIFFKLPAQENYKISIYNIRGQLIKNFTGVAEEGSLFWDGKDMNNQPVSSSIYFCEIKSQNYQNFKKFLFFKN